MKNYQLPVTLLAALTLDIARNRPQSLLRYARALIASLESEPQVEGIEHIPAEGGFVLIYNHYQRPGLWIGFAGAILIDATTRRRGDSAVPLRMLVIDRALVKVAGRNAEFPFSRFFLGRVAHIWGMLPLSADWSDKAQRAAALDRAIRLIGQGEAIAIAPEGAIRGDQGLKPARRGMGRFLRRVSRAGAPVLPAGIWEDSERLYVRIGEPYYVLSDDDDTARVEAMERIGVLLPWAQENKRLEMAGSDLALPIKVEVR